MEEATADIRGGTTVVMDLLADRITEPHHTAHLEDTVATLLRIVQAEVLTSVQVAASMVAEGHMEEAAVVVPTEEVGTAKRK